MLSLSKHDFGVVTFRQAQCDTGTPTVRQGWRRPSMLYLQSAQALAQLDTFLADGGDRAEVSRQDWRGRTSEPALEHRRIHAAEIRRESKIAHVQAREIRI